MGKSASIKNRIRSIKRLLNKKPPPADDVIKAKTKELAQLEGKIEENKTKEKVVKIKKRYKNVRFFEKKKIMRKLDQLRKRLGSLVTSKHMGKEENEIRKQLIQAERDFDYVQLYPDGMKYISLFRGVDDPEVEKERKKIRKLISKNKKRKATEEAEVYVNNRDQGKAEDQEDEASDFFETDDESEEEINTKGGKKGAQKGSEKEKQTKKPKLEESSEGEDDDDEEEVEEEEDSRGESEGAGSDGDSSRTSDSDSN